MDPTNPVLAAFRRVRSADDSLKFTASAQARSRLHLSKASLYKEIELNEEALDEAERAVREDSANSLAFVFQGEMYERRNQLRSALSMYKNARSADARSPIAKTKIGELEAKLASM